MSNTAAVFMWISVNQGLKKVLKETVNNDEAFLVTLLLD